MDKMCNGSSVIYDKKTFDFVSCIMTWILFLFKLLQMALKSLLLEKIFPSQCERACRGPGRAHCQALLKISLSFPNN